MLIKFDLSTISGRRQASRYTIYSIFSWHLSIYCDRFIQHKDDCCWPLVMIIWGQAGQAPLVALPTSAIVNDDGASLNQLNSDFDYVSLWPQLNYPRVVWGLPGGFLMPDVISLTQKRQDAKRFFCLNINSLRLGGFAWAINWNGRVLNAFLR